MPNKEFRVSAGFEYRVVDYKLYWCEKYAPGQGNELNSPNGNGIFFCMAFNYCF
jgi:hypothetical protein